MVKKRACVIGSGFGGLSAAIRLQSQGFDTVVFEKRDLPGGRAYVYKDRGYTFDAGPTVITAPHCLEELFELSGRKMSDYIELLPVEPFYRLCWDDGYRFNYGSDMDETYRQIREKSPEDVEGYRRFLSYSKAVFDRGYTDLVHVPFLRIRTMLKAAPDLIRLQAFRSVYSMVSRYIRDPHLREAFSFHSLLVGGNPFTASSIYTLIHYLERKWGVSFPRGGTGALVQAMVRLFEDLGGKLHVGRGVSRILTANGAVIGVETHDGRQHTFDLVVSNADVVHTYQHLLKQEPCVESSRRKALRMKQSMSLFLIYFGTKKKYPNTAHHSVIFGPRYKELLEDIFNRQILAPDFSLYLHMPTLTDPSLAPEGGETFYVLSPVPHLEKGKIDWKTQGEAYAARILEYLEKHHLPGLRSEIVTQRIFTPEDFKTELNAHHGTAFSFAPVLHQSAYFRAHNRDADLRGLYFVGAGTHPGAGVPGVVNSAKATVSVILEDFGTGSVELARSAKSTFKRGSKTFSLAAKLLGARLEQSAAQVYAWCRYCDDQIDEGKSSVEELRSSTREVFEGKRVDHPAFSAFQKVASQHGIPEAYASDLLDGMAMDVRNPRYETLEELELYSYRVAGTVGLMMSHVMGVSDRSALKHACDLGIAMQLTNIARDVVEDGARGRVYLPQSWLREAGLTDSNLFDPERREALAGVVRRLLKEADRRYQSGRMGIRYLPLRPAIAVAAASSLYREIGNRVISRGSHAWDTRTVVPRYKQFGLVLRAIVEVVLTHGHRVFFKKPTERLLPIWRYPS